MTVRTCRIPCCYTRRLGSWNETQAWSRGVSHDSGSPQVQYTWGLKKSLPRLMTQCIAALQHCNNDYYWLRMSFPALFIALTWQLASAHLCMFVLSPGKSIRFLVSKHCLKWSMTYYSLLAQMWSCLYCSQGLHGMKTLYYTVHTPNLLLHW